MKYLFLGGSQHMKMVEVPEWKGEVSILDFNNRDKEAFVGPFGIINLRQEKYRAYRVAKTGVGYVYGATVYALSQDIVDEYLEQLLHMDIWEYQERG